MLLQCHSWDLGDNMRNWLVSVNIDFFFTVWEVFTHLLYFPISSFFSVPPIKVSITASHSKGRVVLTEFLKSWSFKCVSTTQCFLAVFLKGIKSFLFFSAYKPFFQLQIQQLWKIGGWKIWWLMLGKLKAICMNQLTVGYVIDLKKRFGCVKCCIMPHFWKILCSGTFLRDHELPLQGSSVWYNDLTDFQS